MGEGGDRSGAGRAGNREAADELVLCAARRAALHRGRGCAPLREICAHLGITVRSSAARSLRGQVVRLERQGLLRGSSEHGVTSWALTPIAEQQLALARARGALPRLSESPQHAAWRRARMLARIELGRLGADLRDTLQSCERLLSRLDGPPGRVPSSDEWFATAARLARDCRRVGSAQHCLREWQEPDEEHADLDDLVDEGDERHGAQLPEVRARRAGRRNTRLWSEP